MSPLFPPEYFVPKFWLLALKDLFSHTSSVPIQKHVTKKRNRKNGNAPASHAKTLVSQNDPNNEGVVIEVAVVATIDLVAEICLKNGGRDRITSAPLIYT